MRDHGKPGGEAILGKPRRVITYITLCFLCITLSADEYNNPGTVYWYLMSLIYGLSYSKEYSTILRVILPLKNILHHKDVPMITYDIKPWFYGLSIFIL